MIVNDSLHEGVEAAVHRQSWDWFVDIPARLHVAAEIVDEKGAPVLPAVEGHPGATLRRFLTRPGNPTVRSALSGAIQSRAAQALAIEQLEVACFPLVLGKTAVGALVLARETDTRPSVELQTLGFWLSTVLEAHLANARADESDTFDRVAALHGLLNRVVRTGSARDVVSAFADALAVWDDIEVRGYVEDTRGAFVLDVALPGSDATQASAVLAAESVQSDMGAIRLSRSDAERLGFRSDDDVLIAGLGRADGESWVIALTGRIAERHESRLALSINLLGEAVRQAGRIAVARVDWGILQHLLVGTDDIEGGAREALEELTAAVGGVGSSLTVATASGMRVMAIGDNGASSGPSADETRQIVSTRTVLDRYRMVLTARRRFDAPPFGRREQHIVGGAAAIFGPWLAGILRRPEYSADRRTGTQRFQDVLERMAQQTVREGVSVSVVVMTLPEAPSRPELLRQVVAEIRSQLRDSDLVGALPQGEIAVLLSETSETEAGTVVQRLRGRLASGQGGAEPLSIGVATRSAEWPSDRSVLNAAREQARRECA